MAIHPADARDQAIIARAVRFDVSLFLGTGSFASASAQTLDEAKTKAAALAASNKSSSKPAIYAVDAGGRSALVGGQPYLTAAERKAAAKPAGQKPKPASQTPAKPVSAKAGKAKTGQDAPKAPEQAPQSPPEAAVAAAAPVQAPGQSEQAVSITDPALAQHPIAKANAASWPGKGLSKREAALRSAQSGTLPEPPDFSAQTHKRFRAKLAKLVALAEAGDIEALTAFAINPVSSSPKMMARYRDLAVMALRARGVS